MERFPTQRHPQDPQVRHAKNLVRWERLPLWHFVDRERHNDIYVQRRLRGRQQKSVGDKRQRPCAAEQSVTTDDHHRRVECNHRGSVPILRCMCPWLLQCRMQQKLRRRPRPAGTVTNVHNTVRAEALFASSCSAC